MTLPMTLASTIAELSPGKHQLTVKDIDYVVYYDQQQALGDDGRPVRGDVVGDYSLYRQRSADPDDLVHIASQHVSPHGTSGYGNDYAKAHAAERITEAIADDIRRVGLMRLWRSAMDRNRRWAG